MLRKTVLSIALLGLMTATLTGCGIRNTLAFDQTENCNIVCFDFGA